MRRTFTTSLVAGIGLLLAKPASSVPAAGTSGYATVIVSPHQDDETIRLSAYIAYMADRGDNVGLVTATNGGATYIGPKLGLTKAQTIAWRDREQSAAWAWLTDGRGGPITRLGFEDGAAKRSAIRDAIAAQLDAMTGTPEVYVATYPHDAPDAYIPGPGAGDAHPDHVACILAARDLAADGVTVRYARHPSLSHRWGTATYDTDPQQFERVRAAVAAYKTIGQRSVPRTFGDVLAARGRSVIVR